MTNQASSYLGDFPKTWTHPSGKEKELPNLVSSMRRKWPKLVIETYFVEWNWCWNKTKEELTIFPFNSLFIHARMLIIAHLEWTLSGFHIHWFPSRIWFPLAHKDHLHGKQQAHHCHKSICLQNPILHICSYLCDDSKRGQWRWVWTWKESANWMELPQWEV